MNRKFQTNLEIIRLSDEKDEAQEVIKVGILPFLLKDAEKGSEALEILVMKPHSEGKHKEAPLFQIAKGTRRIFINDSWCDMRDDDLRYADASFYEPLADTALREGAEEVGLNEGNIRQLFDMGQFTFTSVSRGIQKPLRMFAARVGNKDEFTPYESTTAEIRWMTEDEFTTIGRDDHVAIVRSILARLQTVSFV